MCFCLLLFCVLMHGVPIFCCSSLSCVLLSIICFILCPRKKRECVPVCTAPTGTEQALPSSCDGLAQHATSTGCNRTKRLSTDFRGPQRLGACLDMNSEPVESVEC